MNVNFSQLMLSPDGEPMQEAIRDSSGQIEYNDKAKKKPKMRELTYGRVIFSLMSTQNEGEPTIKYSRGRLMKKIMEADGEVNINAEEILLIRQATQDATSWVLFSIFDFIGEIPDDGSDT